MEGDIIIGIDPGMEGGICVYSDGNVLTHGMPETLQDITNVLAGWAGAKFLGLSIFAFVEEPPWSMGINKGVGSVKLHHNRGRIEGILSTCGIHIVNVRPQKWMKTFGLGTRSSCASDTIWKNKLKSEAQRLYPDIKVTHKIADALLIMTYGIRVCEQTRKP